MRVLSWNVRGLGNAARRGQVRTYIHKERIDIVGLQETVKQDFSNHELNELAGGLNFIWLWLSARGRSWGILLGLKSDFLELESHEVKEFCICATIRNRISNFRWILIIVYGPAHHDLSPRFLEELDNCCYAATLPLLLGGDFNLIRACEEKSSDNYNLPLIREFSNFIGKHQLREVAKGGNKFIWTNKQLSPTMVIHDRFLMSDEWENKFPLVQSPSRVGSDHSPIVPKYFFFDSKWLLTSDFEPMVRDKWNQGSSRRPLGVEALNTWHGSMCFLRQHLKGWHIQHLGEHAKEKEILYDQLRELDNLAESNSLSPSEWASIYEIEEKLEIILQMEEQH